MKKNLKNSWKIHYLNLYLLKHNYQNTLLESKTGYQK